MTSPEKLAEQFVSLAPTEPGGCHRVLLSAPGEESVQLVPHANPGMVQDELRAVRRFVAAAIRAGQSSGPTAGRVRPSAVWSGADE